MDYINAQASTILDQIETTTNTESRIVNHFSGVFISTEIINFTYFLKIKLRD